MIPADLSSDLYPHPSVNVKENKGRREGEGVLSSVKPTNSTSLFTS